MLLSPLMCLTERLLVFRSGLVPSTHLVHTSTQPCTPCVVVCLPLQAP
jgi:hypothetical protein